MEYQERELIEGIQKKERKIFVYLFEQYHAPLFRFAETYVCCPGQAEDIVQEVFIKLWERPVLTVKKSLRSYLFLMTRNNCIDYLRSVQVEDKRLKKLMEAQILSDSIDLIIDDKISATINNAVEELPEQCKRIYRMAIFDGLKYADIADELDVSVNAIKVQMFRAKKLLRHKLQNMYENLIMFLFFKTQD